MTAYAAYDNVSARKLLVMTDFVKLHARIAGYIRDPI